MNRTGVLALGMVTSSSSTQSTALEASPRRAGRPNSLDTLNPHQKVDDGTH